MAKKRRTLRKLGMRDITVFKLANRRGYAAIARNCLTEGRSIPQAYGRLTKACRRCGFALPENKLPHPTSL
jgi:hypothetical protein